MREVVLAIPELEKEQNIEIEVKINGKKKTLSYRVEIVSFEEDKNITNDRVTHLKEVIREYDKNWKLVQVGAPTGDKIPVMFRKKNGE